jgi:hypothetical protein
MHVLNDSAAALSTLQAEGIGKPAAVQDFKRRIQKSIEELNITKAQGDLSGRTRHPDSDAEGSFTVG